MSPSHPCPGRATALDNEDEGGKGRRGRKLGKFGKALRDEKNGVSGKIRFSSEPSLLEEEALPPIGAATQKMMENMRKKREKQQEETREKERARVPKKLPGQPLPPPPPAFPPPPKNETRVCVPVSKGDIMTFNTALNEFKVPYFLSFIPHWLCYVPCFVAVDVLTQ